MRVASIDIGTNTILLLIAEKKSRNLDVLLDIYEAPRLGKGVIKGSIIPQENIDRMINVLNKYYKYIQEFEVEKVIVIGTQALRNASNKYDISNLIKRSYGWELNIIEGEEEAKYAYLSIVENHDESNLVIDIGGGSTEIIFGYFKKDPIAISFPCGAVLLQDLIKKNQPEDLNKFLNNYFDEIFAGLKSVTLPSPIKAWGIAGTPITLSAINQGIKQFDQNLLHNSLLKFNAVKKIKNKLLYLTADDVKKEFGEITLGREDIIGFGAAILTYIMERLNLQVLNVSTFGIRHGVIKSL